MNHNLLLRIVVYFQLLATLYIFYMVRVGPDDLSTIHRELIFGLIPGASSLSLVIFYCLFNDYQYSWKQLLFVSISWVANSISTGMCIGMFRI
ncbi:hypothetical protein V144x_28470 [Gimesia aquarii]|uniref:Uncharacterized protein n=1 Tax=Gimesia aquarii TaxID=2527964 RepID=A0A517VWK3_9PLAN|nr:hypothetical protein V144x_28470 [Gimesia aquarii]